MSTLCAIPESVLWNSMRNALSARALSWFVENWMTWADICRVSPALPELSVPAEAGPMNREH